MNIHKNARLTPLDRAELARRVVECGQSIAEVADAVHVCVKTARSAVLRGSRKAGK
jgi:DNA-directed RNA polymerase specialized sigma24 family protein